MKKMLLNAVVIVGLILAGAPSALALSSVDGIADQHFGNWTGTLANVPSQLTTQTLFTDTWALGGPIHYARMVTAWDASSQVTNGCLATTEQFYDDAIAQGLTPVVALWGSYATRCHSDGVPLSPAIYGAAVQSLLRDLYESSSPHTWPLVIEPWNEPNTGEPDPYGVAFTPAVAASYWLAAKAACGDDCTVIAGDYSDSLNHGTPGPSGPVGEDGPARCSAAQINASSYSSVEDEEAQYIAALAAAGAHPRDWGLHPYAESYCHDPSVVNNLTTQLRSAGIGAPRIWLTEFGAFACDPNRGFFVDQDQGQQAGDALWINSTLLRQPDVAHAFYYQFAPAGVPSAPINPNGCVRGAQQDTALYSATTTNGAVQPRAAASTIFGTPDLGAQTLAASEIAPAQSGGGRVYDVKLPATPGSCTSAPSASGTSLTAFLIETAPATVLYNSIFGPVGECFGSTNVGIAAAGLGGTSLGSRLRGYYASDGNKCVLVLYVAAPRPS